MIHANDLMIGDWYAFRGHPYKCTAGDIASIAECEEKGAPTDISEIPLTAEILEKNGLKPDTVEDAYKYCYKKDDVSIVECYANAGGRYRGIFHFGETRLRITLMFVHELQHALRLCEIEHEITL